MTAGNELIFSQFMARTFVVRFIGPALTLLFGASGALAQDRVVLDLPLPPAANTPQLDLKLSTSPLPSTASTGVPTPSASASTATTIVPARYAIARQTLITNELRITVRKGESLYHIFRRHNLNQGDLINMTRSSDPIARRLKRMKVGQQLRVEVTPSGKVERLILADPGPTDAAIERQESDSYTMQTIWDSSLDTPSSQDSPKIESTQQLVHAAPVTERSLIAPQAIETQSEPEQDATAAPVEKPAIPISAHKQLRAKTRSHQIKVKAGDSLYAIFNRVGIPPQDLATLLRAGEPSAHLRRLRPGQNLTLGLSADNSLLSVRAELDETRTFNAVRKDENSFSVAIDTRQLDRRVTTASAVIENALFLAGQRAGLSDRLIMQMVEIFGWDVDFALDVRAGDRFTLIYEELYKDGKKIRDGKILASEFSNRGRSIRAVRYTNKEGRAEYFSPKGFSMRKAFLRTPVNFSRISSRFNRGRMHPVLQRMRAHKGVDYAAQTGTPVKAAGHGRVVSSGRKGGYGKTVVLQHGGTYTTLYAHLSRIHSRARVGKRVKQGEIIGYVGKTGLATGPHLHYEFRVRGVHKDPLRVKLPKALPIDRRYKNDFLRKTRALVSQLDVLARTSIASRD